MVPSRNRLWKDDLQSEFEDTHQYFYGRAHRQARKPPRARSLKSLTEQGLKDPLAPKFGDPGLQALFKRGLIQDLFWQLGSGKEATVYVARGPGGLYAAKLYVDSRVRSFKNDAVYRQGRYIRNQRVEKAIEQRSEFGISVQNYLWVEEEYRQLRFLRQAGVPVPTPVAHAGNVVLMEFIGDEDGPAPRLFEAKLTPGEAGEAFDQAVQNLGLMVRAGRVHGDYSTFNLLWWEGKVVVIDFPQVVELDRNPWAEMILQRDVSGLCRTFGHLGHRADPREVLCRVMQIARGV